MHFLAVDTKNIELYGGPQRPNQPAEVVSYTAIVTDYGLCPDQGELNGPPTVPPREQHFSAPFPSLALSVSGCVCYILLGAFA